MGEQVAATGPDFGTDGIAASEVAEGAIVVGQAHGEPVLLIRCGGEAHAVGAACAHYGAPLADGIVAREESGAFTLRCPWHHARFDLKTGEATNPPALNAIPCYRVEARGERLYVLGRSNEGAKAPGGNPRRESAEAPKSVAIVGAGAAGYAVAEGLRREGFEGTITLFSEDADDPVDRPNLSKDFLAGNAPEEWIALRGPEHFAEHRLDLRRASVLSFDAIDSLAEAVVLATGAEPIRLAIPGAEGDNVVTLRSFADTKRIVARLASAKRVVVIGAGFIGLETAASFTARGLEVHVVGRDPLPLEHIVGRELGELVRDVHFAKGTHFHLGTSPTSIEDGFVTLANGERLAADLVIMGVGVRPRVALAESVGITVDRGIVVDDQLRTSRPGVWACGDVARFPDAASGAMVRIEHWATAQAQGLAVARSIVGRGTPFRAVPFFWSAHHDVTINYVGHAERWDRIDVAGSVGGRDCSLAYRSGGRTLAVATVGRDRDSLRAEVALQNGDEAALAQLIPITR